MGNFSIIIPAYNTSENLKVLLEELLRQKEEFPDTQIIVVDDGSEEDMSWLNDISGIIAIHQPNMGEACARNRGLRFAEQKYIAWIDSDDMIPKDYLKIIYANARKGYDYVVYSWKYKDGTKGVKHEPLLTNWNVWSYTFKRSVLKGKWFDENRNVASDYFWLSEVITADLTRLEVDRSIIIYDGDREDSLSHRLARGEIEIWKNTKTSSTSGT